MIIYASSYQVHVKKYYIVICSRLKINFLGPLSSPSSTIFIPLVNSRKQRFPVSSVPPVPNDEYNECNADLRALSSLSISFSNVTEHAEAFVPLTIAHNGTSYLISLFNAELEGKSRAEIVTAGTTGKPFIFWMKTKTFRIQKLLLTI